MKLKLTFNVEYDPETLEGVNTDDLKTKLVDIARKALGAGTITGDTNARVEDFSYEVTEQPLTPTSTLNALEHAIQFLDNEHSTSEPEGQQIKRKLEAMLKEMAPAPIFDNQAAHDVVDYILRHERDDFEEQLGQSIEALNERMSEFYNAKMNDYIESQSSNERELYWLAVNGTNHVYCDALRAMGMYKHLEVLSSIMDSPTPRVYELYWTKEMLERIYGEELPQSVINKFEKRADKSSDYINETINGVFYEILAKLMEEEDDTK